MQSDKKVRKEIQCKISEFHAALIKAVLAGFVDVLPSFLQALEQILTSLLHTKTATVGGLHTNTLIGQRYDYVSQANMFRPCKNPAQ